MTTAAYAIDIAASMPGGAQTIDELDELTAKLMGGGKGAEFFSDAITGVTTDLAAARAAQTAANVALGEGNQMFRQLEKAALKAAAAEEKAALSGKLDPSMAREAVQTKAALDAYSQTLRGLEGYAAAANAEEARLAKTLTNLKTLSGHVDKSLGSQAESTEKLRGALSSVPGPAGKVGSALLGPVQGFQKLSAEMGAANAAMVIGAAAAVAVAAAIVAVGVAAVGAVVGIAAWAIGLADVNRNAALSQQAVEALDPQIAALSGSYAALTDETGQSAAALNGLVKQLKDAHVAAADMPDALRAAALAETALAGNGGASSFIDDLKAGKVAVGELAAATQAKFGGIVAKQMLGLDASSARLHKNIGDLFGGLNIEGALGGLRTLVDLFDKNSAAGQAMKFLFETVFQPIIDQAQNAAYFVEAFVLGFLIGMTKLYIALKPAIKAVGEFFGFEDTSLADGLDLAKMAGEYIAPVFVGIVAIFGALVVAVALAIAPFVALSAAAYALIGAVVALGVALVGGFMSAWTAVTDYLSGIDLAQMGTDLIMGLVNGITGAAGAVVGAVTGAVGGAIDSAKKLLGIASPSKVFAEIGGYTGEGFAAGVEDSTPDAQAAMAGLVEPPDAQDVPLSPLGAPSLNQAPSGKQTDQVSASGERGGSSKGAGARILEGATLQFFGVKDAEHGASMLEEALTRFYEGQALAIAGGAPK